MTAVLYARTFGVNWRQECRNSLTNWRHAYQTGEWRRLRFVQEAQLSPSDRAMRLVSSYLTNYHATVQKLLSLYDKS